jgi:hypothetical protein
MLFWLLLTAGAITGGMILRPMSIETDFGTFMKTDVNTSTMRDAFLHALSERPDVQDAGRRLQTVYKNFDVVLAYEPDGDASPSSFSDIGALTQVANFEQRLRDLPGWKELCSTTAEHARALCENGISLAGYSFPSQGFDPMEVQTGGCADNAAFVDEMGYHCSDIAWYYCDHLSEKNGYSQQGEDDLLANCPQSCGTCNVSEQGGVLHSAVPNYLVLDGRGSEMADPAATDEIIRQHSIRELVLWPDGTTTKIRSVFRFVQRCCDTSDAPADQKSSMRQLDKDWLRFAKNELLPLLQEGSRGIDNGDWKLKVYFSGSKLSDLEVMTSLYNDLYLAAGSMVFVILYMLFHTKSLLLSLVGFLVIILSIPTAYAVFAMTTGQTTMSIASFLALFLVIGLGSDVVFIYTDFWRNSEKIADDVPTRLSWTALHAGKASLVTTSITAVSFFANIASVLKPLREFGFFMGLCVMLAWALLTAILVPACALDERLSICFRNCCQCRRRRRLRCRLCCCFVRRVSEPDVKRKRCDEVIFDLWMASIYYQRRPCVLVSVVMVAASLSWAVAVLGVDTGVPNIFPEDHNQNRGKEVLDGFTDISAVFEPLYVPKDQTVKVCKEHDFEASSDCHMFWCEVNVHTADLQQGSCSCLRDSAASCPQAHAISQRYVGLESLDSSQRAALAAHVAGELSVEPGQVQVQPSRVLKPLLHREWDTGMSSVEPLIQVEVTTSLPASCVWQEVCFCGVQACTPAKGWELVSPVNLTSQRRLLSELSGDPGAALALVFAPPRALADPAQGGQIPLNRRGMVDVAFGIDLFLSSPTLGVVDMDESWAFNPDHDVSNPWTQRSMYSFCANMPENLLVTKRRCWMEDFRAFAIAQYGKFPVMQADFPELVEKFTRTALSDATLAAEAFWLRDGTIKASFASFWLNVDKRSIDADFALELKAAWDEYVDAYNDGSSRSAKGAWHSSNLWVMAEAQKELVAGTLTTLVLAVALAFVGMLWITFDWVLSFLVVFATCGIISMLMFHITVIMALPIGPIEVIALIVFIGYAVTYSLHVAHHYSGPCPEELVDASRVEIRLWRVNKSLAAIGSAALGSAATTSGCSVFLLLCTLTVFTRLGSVVMAVTLMSIFVALGPLPSVLLMFGPVNPGSNCFPGIGGVIRCWVRRKQRHLIDAGIVPRVLDSREVTDARARGSHEVAEAPKRDHAVLGDRPGISEANGPVVV